MTKPALTLGISPCPNDTFIFEALLNGRSEAGFTAVPHIADVEELNTLAASGKLDITKLSLAAVPGVLDSYVLINCGGALGRGCGPLVVARPDISQDSYAQCDIAIPGVMTTANLLLSLCGRFYGKRIPMLFDKVMPAVASGQTGLGAIIHEGRFTYEAQGLRLVLDLGDWWEKSTGLPLPLGVIAVKRSLGEKTIAAVQDAVKKSLEHAFAHPDDGRPFVRSHAQEMDEAVLASHIRTFVNDFSLDLGEEGRGAISALLRAAAEQQGGALPDLPIFAKVE